MTGNDSGGRWTSTLERSFIACAVLVLVIHVAICVLVFLAGTTSALTTETVTRLALVFTIDVVLLVMCLATVRRDQRDSGLFARAMALTLAAISLVAAAGLVGGTGLAPGAATLLPHNALSALQLTVIALFSWRPALVGVLGAGALYVWSRVWQTAATWSLALAEAALPTPPMVGVLLLVAYLRKGAAAADQLDERAHRETAAVRARQNAEIARDEARRVIHDTVITALRAVELRLGRSPVQVAAEQALTSLRGARSATSGQDLEDQLIAAAPIQITVDSEEWVVPPPPRILDALVGAAGEALRNAVRHGHATHAAITLVSTDARTEVRVRDNGTGLPDDWRPGFGVGESIYARMQDVGGGASVETGPDCTVVGLWWPTQELGPDTVELLLPNLQTLRTQIAGGAAIFGAYWMFQYSSPIGTLDIAVFASLLALLAVAALPVTSRVVAAEPTGLAAIVVWICAVIWFGLVAAGSGSLVSSDSWIVGSAATATALLAFQVPSRQVVLIVGAVVATVVTAAAWDPMVAVAEPVGAYGTPILVGGAGALLGVALRRAAAVMRDGERRLAALAESNAWLVEASQWRKAHHAYLESDVVPFLERAVESGTADPVEAGLLSALCRDHLYLTHPIDAETVDQIQDARRDGVRVAIRAGDHHPNTWPLLRRVLEHAEPGQSVTVTQETADHAHVVVIPPLSLGSLKGCDGHSDGIRSVFPVPGPHLDSSVG